MRELIYAFALCIIFLTGCSQDEAMMENKGELVTLNYDVSLADDVLSRTSSEEVVVNQLLCVVYEGDKVIKREIVELGNDGKFRFSPVLFGNVEYHVVFWAYYSTNNASCFDMTDVTSIRTNDNYGKGNFRANKYRDAFTNVDVIKMADSPMNTSITLSRPFAKLNILVAENDLENIKGGSCHVVLEGCTDTFNALEQKWTGEATSQNLYPAIQIGKEVEYGGYKYHNTVSEYVFANGTLTGGSIVIYDKNGEAIYGNTKLETIPFDPNKETNIYISLY